VGHLHPSPQSRTPLIRLMAHTGATGLCVLQPAHLHPAPQSQGPPSRIAHPGTTIPSAEASSGSSNTGHIVGGVLVGVLRMFWCIRQPGHLHLSGLQSHGRPSPIAHPGVICKTGPSVWFACKPHEAESYLLCCTCVRCLFTGDTSLSL
jgi:hypothetical protein